MKAVAATGKGGYEKLEYRDVPVPRIAGHEVLVEGLAAGVNSTDINTISIDSGDRVLRPRRRRRFP